MKRITASLSALLILSALFTLTSCHKEETSNGHQFRATMEDCTSQNGKTTLSGTNLNWVGGDRIAVYGTAGRGIYSATPQTPATTAIFDNVSGETGNAPFRAFYPTTLTTDGVNITLPATQTYVENSIHEFPMYAESSNNTLNFKNLCGALKLHLTKADVNVTTIYVTVPTPDPVINGTFSISHNANGPQLIPVSGGNAITLTCATAQSIASGKDFYIYLPAGDYNGLKIEMNTDDGRYCIKTANTAINVARSQYTLINLGENDLNFVEPLPQGALSGLFSVSATQQVRFSQGNLQYQASTNTWRFAEHQYDYVGSANSNISPTYTGWIDLFGWGTGNNPTLTSTNTYSYNTFVDWGTHAISNGCNMPNVWRTLSSSEWNYLFSSRSNASSKYAWSRVNGHGGEIILPDDFELPQGLTFNPGQPGPGLVNNDYSLSEWTLMEAAGAVFLPASYRRVGTTINRSGYCCYWTSSYFGSGQAKRLYCVSHSVYTTYGESSNNGLSVRLVTDEN